MKENEEPIVEGMGLKTEKYTWKQTTSDVDLRMEIPTNLRGRDLEVSITPTSIKIKIKTEETPLLEGDFVHPVKAEESHWEIGLIPLVE